MISRQAYIGRRLFTVMVGVSLVMLVIWLQVIHLQVVGASRPERAPQTVSSAIAPMGTVVDRRGRVLAMDVPYHVLYISPALLDDTELPDVRSWLEEQGLGDAVWGEVARAYEQKAQTPVAVPNISRLVAEAARAKRVELSEEGVMPWLWVETRWVRYYPNRTLAFHVLGYRNRQIPPKVEGGVHAYYRDFLARCQGLAPDHKREAPLPGGASPFFPSPFRCDLVLTIDTAVQYAVEQELAHAVEVYEPHSATAIVMDPRDGAILAMASWPVFDPERVYTDPEEVAEAMRNRAVSMMYEPGSVVKAITFATAYDSGVIRENSRIRDEAQIEYAEGIIRNAGGKGYGMVDPATILSRSLNVATARVAVKTGPDIFYSYLKKFGFGRPTEIDLANEYAGLVRWPNDVHWAYFDLATNAFGQGISVTPIQLIRAMAVIANGGVLVRPHVLRGFYKQDTYYEVTWPVGRRVLRAKTSKVVTGWLTKAVEAMAGSGVRVPGVAVAGKTGTAEIAEEEGYTTQDRNVTFVGYFPAEDPKVIVLVMMERPQKGPNGEPVTALWALNTAYPTFVRIANAILPYLR